MSFEYLREVLERSTRSEPQGDSLYIDLSDEPSVESREISEGVVLDYNAAGRLVSIDIDEASKRVQLDKLVLSQLPSTVETAAA